ncbi:MAG: alpha/beta fold hydrolase [Alphaproteobacteria bacterium]|nr:alpha/beta fold hydrolase [Alphaproteobacteria bacterium]
MPHAPLPDLQLYYERRGAGPPVLLIMGLSVGVEGWSGQLDALAQDHEVCAFDNRGVCRSDAPWGLYTTGQLAEDALALMDHLGWERAHVVGHSLGGMIAQELSLRAPERVRTLSLLSTHGGGLIDGLPTSTAMWCILRSLTARSREAALQASMTSNLSPRYVEQVGWQSILDDLLRYPARARPLSGVLGQLHAALRHDARPRLEALREKPVLVVHGADDLMVRPRNGRWLAETLEAEWLHLEDAGHAFIYEQPERTNALLREHFRRG